MIYWILGRQFPYGTLVVNISGCFLMGLLFVLILERFDGVGPQLRSFLLIGLLGGYTTFSSFSIETLSLFENGAWLNAFFKYIFKRHSMSFGNMDWNIRRKTDMNTVDVTIVRIYVMESEHLINSIISYLKNEAKIRGISVFRAISGFGQTGNHSASLIDLSLDLPLVIEFFDSNDKVNLALEHLSKTVKHEHIVFWDAKSND